MKDQETLEALRSHQGSTIFPDDETLVLPYEESEALVLPLENLAEKTEIIQGELKQRIEDKLDSESRFLEDKIAKAKADNLELERELAEKKDQNSKDSTWDAWEFRPVPDEFSQIAAILPSDSEEAKEIEKLVKSEQELVKMVEKAKVLQNSILERVEKTKDKLNSQRNTETTIVDDENQEMIERQEKEEKKRKLLLELQKIKQDNESLQSKLDGFVQLFDGGASPASQTARMILDNEENALNRISAIPNVSEAAEPFYLGENINNKNNLMEIINERSKINASEMNERISQQARIKSLHDNANALYGFWQTVDGFHRKESPNGEIPRPLDLESSANADGQSISYTNTGVLKAQNQLLGGGSPTDNQLLAKLHDLQSQEEMISALEKRAEQDIENLDTQLHNLDSRSSPVYSLNYSQSVEQIRNEKIRELSNSYRKDLANNLESLPAGSSPEKLSDLPHALQTSSKEVIVFQSPEERSLAAIAQSALKNVANAVTEIVTSPSNIAEFRLSSASAASGASALSMSSMQHISAKQPAGKPSLRLGPSGAGSGAASRRSSKGSRSSSKQPSPTDREHPSGLPPHISVLPGATPGPVDALSRTSGGNNANLLPPPQPSPPMQNRSLIEQAREKISLLSASRGSSVAPSPVDAVAEQRDQIIPDVEQFFSANSVLTQDAGNANTNTSLRNNVLLDKSKSQKELLHEQKHAEIQSEIENSKRTSESYENEIKKKQGEILRQQERNGQISSELLNKRWNERTSGSSSTGLPAGSTSSKSRTQNRNMSASPSPTAANSVSDSLLKKVAIPQIKFTTKGQAVVVNNVADRLSASSNTSGKFTFDPKGRNSPESSIYGSMDRARMEWRSLTLAPENNRISEGKHNLSNPSKTSKNVSDLKSAYHSSIESRNSAIDPLNEGMIMSKSEVGDALERTITDLHAPDMMSSTYVLGDALSGTAVDFSSTQDEIFNNMRNRISTEEIALNLTDDKRIEAERNEKEAESQIFQIERDLEITRAAKVGALRHLEEAQKNHDKSTEAIAKRELQKLEDEERKEELGKKKLEQAREVAEKSALVAEEEELNVLEGMVVQAEQQEFEAEKKLQQTLDKLDEIKASELTVEHNLKVAFEKGNAGEVELAKQEMKQLKLKEEILEHEKRQDQKMIEVAETQHKNAAHTEVDLAEKIAAHADEAFKNAQSHVKSSTKKVLTLAIMRNGAEENLKNARLRNDKELEANAIRELDQIAADEIRSECEIEKQKHHLKDAEIKRDEAFKNRDAARKDERVH